MSKPKNNYSVDVPLEIIKELLTDSEWRMVKQRLVIIKYLKEGLSIRAIAEKAKVGTDTVVRVARKLEGSPNLQKISQGFSSTSSSSKWIFGRINSKD